MPEVARPTYVQKLVRRIDNGSVKVVTGVRRTGKSYLLKRLFKNYLLGEGVPAESILEFTLDDIRDAEYLDPRKIYDAVAEAAARRHVFAFIDEIQLIDDFAPLMNGLLHLDGVDLYVTGSNSRLLSSDILTEFRGRGDEVRVLPLSFSEFASVYEGSADEALRQYLIYGGMPELLTRRDHEQRAGYLNDLVRKVYLDDIVDRHGVRLPDELEGIFDDLCSSVGSFTNPTKIANTMRSVKGSKIDPNTVKAYIGYFEDAFLFEGAKRFDVRGRRYFDTLVKYYVVDVGLRNARLNYRQLDENHIMESVVYTELRRRGFGVDVGMVRSREQKDGKRTEVQLEVDFVANKGDKRYYVQVAQGLDDPGKEEQEKRPFSKIDDGFKRIIVVRDELMPHYGQDGILIIGLRDFLMDPGSLDV